MSAPHWIDGPPPSCVVRACPRPATHYYLDAPTGGWRYGCERHMRRRRADPEQVACVLLRGATRRGTDHPTNSPTNRPSTP